MSNLLSMWNITRIAKRRASDLGVAIDFDDMCTVPYYEKGKIVFPEPHVNMSDEEYKKLKHSYIHEPLHHTRKHTIKILCEYIKANKNIPDELNKVWNIVEDDSMEREHAEMYAGDAEDMSLGMECGIEARMGTIEQLAKEEHVDPEATKMIAMTAMALDSRSDWDKRAAGKLAELDTIMPEEAKTLYELLKNSGWVQRMRRAVTQDAVHDVSRSLTQLLYPDVELPPEPPCCGGGGEGEGEEPQSGEGDEDEAQGGEEADAELQEGLNKLNGEPLKEHKDTWKTVKWEDLNPSEMRHGEGQPEMEGLGSENQHIDYGDTNPQSTKYEFSPAREQSKVFRDLKTERSVRGTPESWSHERVEDRALANQVRRHIQVMTRKSLHTERLEGKIHNRNLYRVAVPQVGDGDWNRRIFKKKKDGMNLDTAVTVLVDSSGSMGQSKMEMAVQGAQSMLHVFDRVLHIPVELLMFGTGYGGGDGWMHFGVVKNFTERTYTPHEIADRMYTFKDRVSGNQDPDAVIWAADRLSRRPEKRKMLLVLSDGCPTCSDYGSADQGLFQVVEQVKKEAKVELYGIGIMDDNVSRYYGKNAKAVWKLEELNPTILETIKEGVLHD